jgi:hypothetical protein
MNWAFSPAVCADYFRTTWQDRSEPCVFQCDPIYENICTTLLYTSFWIEALLWFSAVFPGLFADGTPTFEVGFNRPLSNPHPLTSHHFSCHWELDALLNPMVQSPLQADSRATGEELSWLLWNPRVNDRVHVMGG